MTNPNIVLEEYTTSVKRLKQQCTEAGMSDEEFKKLYLETLQSLDTGSNVPSSSCNWYKKIGSVLSIIILIGLIYYIVPYNGFSCSLQDYIYPGLRILRKLSIPIISLFPSLTALYHETCLIQNPFFTVVDMDCWPCSHVNSVREIHDAKPVTEQNTAPFIYETDQKIINLENLRKIYFSNKDLFDKEAPKVQTTEKSYINPYDMFQNIHNENKLYYIWKFNSMNAAKVLRQVIPRPKVVPKFGQSTERFIIIDTSHQMFRIPDTECSFSLLLSLSGTRTILLQPAEECQHECKSLKVDLKESYLLWYNWWYWRPVVQPSNGNTTFIAHTGSYC